MWNKLSIKWQLILFMTLVVTIVEISTLLVILNLQNSQNKDNAIIQVQKVTKSLNQDFLRFILSPSADAITDIKSRLSAFDEINGLILLNDMNQTIYAYKSIKNLQLNKIQMITTQEIFTDENLYVKHHLAMDSYIYGYTLIDINLQEYKKKQDAIVFSILKTLPFALLLGFIISQFLSKSFTQPFTILLQAMKNSDPTHNEIVSIQTSSNNEIKKLFNGYNTLMQQVSDASGKLQFQAEHDKLTGVHNRFFIEEELKEVLKNESNLTYNLLYLNLDQFKLINDSAGYQAGDELLKMIVCEYSKILPDCTTFGRVDGDGFMVLLKDSSKESGLDFLNKSLTKLSDFRFTPGQEVYSVSASIGFVHFKPFEYTFTELIKAINSSLYSAKEKGRNKFHIFNPDDGIAKRFEQELETASYVKEALSSGPSKFELFAQAIVPLQYETSKVSYEILIRMWDKNNNFVPPDNFLPTAQRYQLMTEIDIWVLWTYLEQVTKNPEHIKNLHSAHINLAGSSLTNPDFQAKIKEAVTHFNFPWEKLELEVTETSAVGNFAQANEFILWLKNIGIGLALDDFGTGMASFEYLKSMPFDVVKIDGSFVKDMHTDPIDKAVIKYIHEISELKGQETVAEYVETQEDVDALKEIGITYGQGYFLGKPKTLKEWL
ncbi:EAL domain-containing protein [uncultured Sulfurimonas sp.]|uniref:EAL domain-containing protein n=1 Tax=uncultured Sulfurimonas sp. TaxID=291845 RepID=UPI0032B22F39